MGNLLKCVISCSNWNNTSNAGVWNSNLNNNRTNSNNNIGFRLGLQFHLISLCLEKSGATGRVFPALSETNRCLLFGKETEKQEAPQF
jgi:hypothetical protein